jgi:type VI secretion system secreted protein VgrG
MVADQGHLTMEDGLVEGVWAELQVAGERAGHVRRVVLDERLSGASVAWVDVDPAVDAPAGPDPDGLIGCSAELVLGRGEVSGGERRFCGVVREVERAAGRPGFRARVEPGFACLDEERRTRPFVRLSALEILRAVLGDDLAALGGREVEVRLAGQDRPADGADRDADGFLRRELCVQYGETTYDFCRRLLSEEGLAFLYDHGGSVEKLLVVEPGRFEHGDGPVRVAPRTGQEADAESVFGLARALARPPGRSVPRTLDLADPLATADDGRRRRGVADDAGGPEITGAGDVLAFAPGRLVTLTGPPDAALPDWAEGDLLLTHVRQVAELPPEQAAEEGRGSRKASSVVCSFAARPARLGYAPPRIARPRALEDWGLVVSGIDGDPIDPDPRGGVRVRFLYDRREQAAAEDRSCFVPVAQAWAGNGYGTEIIPRAGMLVRLEYILGDPDRPVIADCFPTGANTVPAPLPDRKSRLTLRTQSLRDRAEDDAHWNEIALDDAAAAEEVSIRAGRDLRRHVLHDEHARTDHDETRVVGGQQSLRVAGQRARRVGGGETERVGGARRTAVGADDERLVDVPDDDGGGGGAGGHDALTVDGDAEEDVGAARALRVEGAERGELRAGRSVKVQGNAQLSVSATRTEVGDRALHARQSKSAVSLTDSNATLAAEHALALFNEAGALLMVPGGNTTLKVSRLELRCGSAAVIIGDGKIAIKAPTVVARGAKGMIRLDAAGASTVGKDVHASAVILNEIKGLPVIISDSPGNADTLAAENIDVENKLGAAEAFSLTPLAPNRQPMPNTAYRVLTPSGAILAGTTDADGKLVVKVPPGTESVDAIFLTDDGNGDPVKMDLKLEEDK